MEYRILGPLEVREGDRTIPLGSAKQRAVLALLLLNANRVVSTEQLVDSLWGDNPPERAVETVQVYVSRLRKLLPADTLVTRAPGYLIRVDPDELDLERFHRLRADGKLHDALALWRGPPLAELDVPFARVDRARLEDLRLAVLEERIENDLESGRHGQLTGELEALVVEHPHREQLRAQLMRALYGAGRHADALAAYRDAHAALAELGLQPAAALKRLERQILQHDVSLEAPRPLRSEGRRPLPGPLVPESPFPFVGRAAELEQLRTLLERAERGEGAVALVTGEPGAGKTRLVRELAHEAADGGALVLYGLSDAVVRAPYQPLREWLRFLLRVADPDRLRASLGSEAEQLARIVPELAERPDTDADRYVLQTAATTALTRMSSSQPLLLIADDLHWADAETLTLFRRLAQAAPEGRLLLVGAFRDPGGEMTAELREAVADLSRLDAVSRIELHGLSDHEVRAFVRASANADATSDLASAMGELTDGTPLLVCELWRDLSDARGIEVSNGAVKLARAVDDLRGPQRLREMVQQRLSRLSPDASRLVELAAVAGPRFQLRVVSAAAGLDDATLAESVRQACRHGFLEEVPAAMPTCRFTHELVRRAVYDPIERVRLPELHLRVGEALEQVHALDAELAHHFTLAVPVAGTERAVAYNLRAADAAKASFAYDDAASRLATALELGIADPRERVHAQVELGYMYQQARRIAEAEAILTATIEAATGLEERALATRALVHVTRQRLDYAGVGSTECLPVAEEAIRTFEQLGDRGGIALAEHLLGDALARGGRVSEGLAALDRALEHAEAAGDQLIKLDVITRIARRVCETATPADEVIERLAELRLSTRDAPAVDAFLRGCSALALAMVGRTADARKQLESIAGTEVGGDGLWLIAEAYELVDDVATAERELAAAFERRRAQRGGEKRDSTAMRIGALLALIYCDQGRWDEAATLLEYGREVDAEQPAVGQVYAILRVAARARVASHEGRISEGLDLGRCAVELAERSEWLNYRARAWLAFAEVLRSAGHSADADAAVATALELYALKRNATAAERVPVTITS